jgi:hypothetical protein
MEPEKPLTVPTSTRYRLRLRDTFSRNTFNLFLNKNFDLIEFVEAKI